MENLKHTQGRYQWEARDLETTKPFISCENKNGATEFICHIDVNFKDRKEVNANAKLIEQAPNLLNAAILCESITEKCNNAMLPQHVQELLKSLNDTLKEAINKAIN
jgi:hypothetical protein